MSSLYSVPKLEVEAEISFPDSSKSLVTLFLSQQARSHTGYERLSDLLNAEDSFAPARTLDERFIVLNLDSLLLVDVDRSCEFAHQPGYKDVEDSDQALSLDIDVHLTDGSLRQGTIIYLLPPAQRRLQNVLNLGDRFLIMHEGDRVRFINRRHIVKACPKA